VFHGVSERDELTVESPQDFIDSVKNVSNMNNGPSTYLALVQRNPTECGESGN